MMLWEDPKLAKITSNLKKVRMLRKLTQDELSGLSGVNIKSLAAYEQQPEKLSNASVTTVFKLAQALNCDIMDIVNKESLSIKENN